MSFRSKCKNNIKNTSQFLENNRERHIHDHVTKVFINKIQTALRIMENYDKFSCFKIKNLPDMVAHTYNSRAQEAEAEGSSGVQSQSGLHKQVQGQSVQHGETLSQIN